jgi:DNA repair exonuclease SbcCD ATPase subunit
MFEQKERLAKDESKKYFTRLKDFEDNNLSIVLATEQQNAIAIRTKILDHDQRRNQCDKLLNEMLSSLATLRESKVIVDCDLDIDEVKDRLDEIQKTREKLGKDLEWKRTKEREVTDQIKELKEDLKDYPIDELKESLEKLGKLRALLLAATSELKMKASTLQIVQRDSKLLDKVPCGDKFPKCQFLVGAIKAKSQIPDKEEKVESIKKSIKNIEVEIKKLEEPDIENLVKEHKEKTRLLKASEDTKRECKLRIENIKLRLDSEQSKESLALKDLIKLTDNQVSISKNKEIDKKISDLVGRSATERKLRGEIDSVLMELNKDLGAKENIIERLAKELESLKEIRILCDAYEHYIVAMGKNGIAYQILVDKLPMLNDEINKILSSVADFNIFLEHNDEEQSIKLLLQYGDYKGRPLELGGGAERELASIAIRTALLSVTSLPKTNMFVIDEGFGKLDPKNMDNISKMFDYLRSVFDHVIIISHIDILKDMVDTSIEITFDEERYSHIEVC